LTPEKTINSKVHHDRPQIHLTARRVVLEEDLVPILGNFTLSPLHLHMHTQSFKHDLVLVIKFGSRPPVMSRVFSRNVDIVFGFADKMTFAVTNAHDLIVFQGSTL